MHDDICMFCKRGDLEFISTSYKNVGGSIHDQITEIFGDVVRHYFKNNTVSCFECMKIVEFTRQLRTQLYDTIVDNGVSLEVWGTPGKKVFSFYTLWHTYLSNYSYLNYGGAIERGSPNNLLMATSSIPFDQRSDTDVDVANNKYRNYGSDTPTLDEEVQRMTSRGRRKARGNKWSRRKGSQSIRSRNCYTRSNSLYSRTSHISGSSRLSRATVGSKRVEMQVQSKDIQMTRILGDFLFQSDSLSHFTREYLKKHVQKLNLDSDDLPSTVNGNSIARTRFACKFRDDLLQQYENYMYECPNANCNITLCNLEDITTHRVTNHNEMALFWCEQCKFSYITQKHLDKHMYMHDQGFIAYCIYCSEEYRDKSRYEEHLNEHLIHSFPCIYCDKFFLNKQLCENHIREQHPGRKRKIKRIKPQSILDRIDKNPENTSSPSQLNPNLNKEEFIVKVLCQKGRMEETCLPIQDEDEDNSKLLSLENLEAIDSVNCLEGGDNL